MKRLVAFPPPPPPAWTLVYRRVNLQDSLGFPVDCGRLGTCPLNKPSVVFALGAISAHTPKRLQVIYEITVSVELTKTPFLLAPCQRTSPN